MSDHTVAELLEIIGKGSSEPTPVSDSKLGDFLTKFSIERGQDRIPNYIIFYTYKEVFGGEMSKIGFFREFNKRFHQVRTGKQRSYLLNKESFDYSHEGLTRAKHFDGRL